MGRSFASGAVVMLTVLSAAAFGADIDVANVDYREADRIYSTDAVVEAVRQSTIAARVMGRIVELRVDVGDVVKAGQVVARIDPREASEVLASNQAQVAQAQANLENARLARDRARALAEQNFVSKASVDQAEAQYKAALAQLKAAQATAGQAVVSKGYTTVVAPYSGVVSARHVELGEMASPGKPLFTTFDPKDMRVIAEVPQTYVGDVKKFSKVRVEIPTQNKTVEVKDIVAVPSADPRTHSTRFRLFLARNDNGVYPGVYARAHFTVGQARKLVLPAQAVVRRSEVSGVLVVGESGKASFRQVRLGEAAGEGLIEVLAGVAAGERVALNPIKAGMVAPQAGRSGS